MEWSFLFDGQLRISIVALHTAAIHLTRQNRFEAAELGKVNCAQGCPPGAHGVIYLHPPGAHVFFINCL